MGLCSVPDTGCMPIPRRIEEEAANQTKMRTGMGVRVGGEEYVGGIGKKLRTAELGSGTDSLPSLTLLFTPSYRDC